MTLHFEGILKGSSSGGGGDTPSASSSLYELKKYPQGLIVDNWCNINSKKELAKATIPTVYADMLEKYQNVDTGTSDLTTKSSTSAPFFFLNGYYYFTEYSGSSSYTYYIKRSAYADLSDAETVYSKTVGSWGGHRLFYLAKGEDVILFFCQGQNTRTVEYYAIKFDLNFNLLDTVVISNGNDADPNGENQWGNPIFYDNKFYFFAFQGNNMSQMFCYDYVNNVLTSGGSYKWNYGKSNAVIYDGYLYFYHAGNDDYKGHIRRISLSNFGAGSEDLLVAGDWGTIGSNHVCFFVYNNELKLLSEKVLATIDTTNFTYSTVTAQSVLGFSPSGQVCFIKKIGGTYYVAIKNTIYTTTDWQTFVSYLTVPNDFGSMYYAADTGLTITSDNSVMVLAGGWYNATYYYISTYRVEYTDDYIIDGNTVSIKYFKNAGWKICVPDTTNDANLETVYTSIGYLPYWRMDVTGEKLTLVRTNKAFTYMYVGDGYKDSTTPTGEWEG